MNRRNLLLGALCAPLAKLLGRQAEPIPDGMVQATDGLGNVSTQPMGAAQTLATADPYPITITVSDSSGTRTEIGWVWMT